MKQDAILAPEVEEIIRTVRSALEMEDVKMAYVGFNWFPKGSCMDASILLGIILQENGIDSLTYVSAEYGVSTHSWLEYKGYLIDITADQFEGQHPKVMIEKLSEIHLGFRVTGRYPVTKDAIPKVFGFVDALSKVRKCSTR